MESDDTSRNTNLDVKPKDEHAKEKMKENTDRKAQAQVQILRLVKLFSSIKQRKKIQYVILPVTFPSSKD